jgi:hypothetical protein
MERWPVRVAGPWVGLWAGNVEVTDPWLGPHKGRFGRRDAFRLTPSAIYRLSIIRVRASPARFEQHQAFVVLLV